MLDLDRLAALEAAATPGEWETTRDWTPENLPCAVETRAGTTVAVTTTWNAARGEAEANAALIAALRNDARALIAAAREHSALLARAQRAEADAARLRAALTATMQRATGYDWNADPDNITLLQSEALHV